MRAAQGGRQAGDRRHDSHELPHRRMPQYSPERTASSGLPPPRAGQRTAWRPRPAAHTSGRCARCTRSWRLSRARPGRVAAAARHGPHAQPETPIQAPARAHAAPLPHIRGGAGTRAPRQQMRASRGRPSPPLAVPAGQAPRVARAPARAGRPRAAHRQGVHARHTHALQTAIRHSTRGACGDVSRYRNLLSGTASERRTLPDPTVKCTGASTALQI